LGEASDLDDLQEVVLLGLELLLKKLYELLLADEARVAVADLDEAFFECSLVLKSDFLEHSYNSFLILEVDLFRSAAFGAAGSFVGIKCLYEHKTCPMSQSFIPLIQLIIFLLQLSIVFDERITSLNQFGLVFPQFFLAGAAA